MSVRNWKQAAEVARVPGARAAQQTRAPRTCQRGWSLRRGQWDTPGERKQMRARVSLCLQRWLWVLSGGRAWEHRVKGGRAARWLPQLSRGEIKVTRLGGPQCSLTEVGQFRSYSI